MGEAFIYDACRTPRGRGKDSGALYTVRPIDLLATVLAAVRERYTVSAMVERTSTVYRRVLAGVAARR